MTALTIIGDARHSGRQEVLLELIEWVKKESEGQDEGQFRALLDVLTRLQDMAGLARTYGK